MGKRHQNAIHERRIMDTQLNELKRAVTDFVTLGTLSSSEADYNMVVSKMHNLCALVSRVSNHTGREEILEIIRPVREIHSKSPFLRRLQSWPRGYNGDFETIDYLLEGKNTSPSGTIAYYCEAYALKSAPAQQHHNKMVEQTHLILETCLRPKPDKETRILSIACGSCPDLQKIQDVVCDTPTQFHLVDYDKEALMTAKRKLDKIRPKCIFMNGDILRIVKNAIHFKFDLVVSNGLFDYLSDTAFVYLLTTLYRHSLKDNAKIFLTNIGKDCPYKVWMTYFVNWNLIERDEKQLLDLCASSGIDRDAITIRKDASNLTYLLEIVKG